MQGIIGGWKNVIDVLSCELQSAEAYLIEEVAFVGMIFKYDKSDLGCFYVHLCHFFYFTCCIFWLGKCDITVFLEIFVLVLIQMIEDIDSRGDFGWMWGDFYWFE